MRLLEFEGKRLLQRYGIPVPTGSVWPDIPDIGGRPVVVKAQVREGGRGKRGGVRFVEGLAQVPAVAEELLATRLGQSRVEQVYVEERLEVGQELYVAMTLDRDRRAPVLLASPSGGLDVEDAAADVVRLPIDPLLGLRPSAVGYVLKTIGLTGEMSERVGSTIGKLHQAYVAEDAELLEINPLVVTRSGHVVAADARVVLDDNARFRHPDWPSDVHDGTAFERAVARYGAVGVDINPEGNAVVITSGAGLMMATLDRLGFGGVTLRAAIDLGGTVFRESRLIGDIVREALRLQPDVVFFNAFFQLASCRRLAEGIRAGLEAEAYGGRVVARLAGSDVAEARKVLQQLTILEDFEQASRVVVELAVGKPG